MTHPQKQRLSGIDLVRGIAAYAVIQVHSGDETWGSVEPSALTFRLLFYFAVPFFLAASFFFSTRKTDGTTSWNFWKSKIERILIPYALWSIVYLVFRFVFFSLTHQSTKLQTLFRDPLSIIFFGGASYQLYFLPLLFAGTFLILLANYFEKRKISNIGLAIQIVLSMLFYEALVISGNDFQLGSGIAFAGLSSAIAQEANQNHALRFILVQISWLIRCLPYMLVAVLLNRWLNKIGISRLCYLPIAGWFFVIFLLVNAIDIYLLPNALNDIFIAYFLLLTGISISKDLGERKIVRNLGACSFGIYLIHPIVMNLVKPIVHKLLPESLGQVSISSMLAFCIPTFLLSWLFVSFIKQERRIAKYLFGI